MLACREFQVQFGVEIHDKRRGESEQPRMRMQYITEDLRVEAKRKTFVMIRYSRRTLKRNVSPTPSKLEIVKGFAPGRVCSMGRIVI